MKLVLIMHQCVTHGGYTVLLLHVTHVHIVCCDLHAYLQFADFHSQSPSNSVVSSESKVASTGSYVHWIIKRSKCLSSSADMKAHLYSARESS